MRKSHIWLIVVSTILLTFGIGVTVAYLVSSTNTVENTFTVGSVSITLTETTGTEYKMIPGATVKKDPIVTVQSGSESCWLFVKLEKSADFETFCTFEMQEGWIALAGNSGIFYRGVEKSPENKAFPVLKDDSIQIRDTLTEEQLNAVTENPTLKIIAYAAQSEGLATAHDAWQILNP